jgi:hypothetical protein
MNSMTTEELRTKRLEEMVKDLLGRLAGIEHKLGQVAEDNSRDSDAARSQTSIRHYFAQASGEISPTTDNTLGAGNANILQVIGGDRYQRSPELVVPVVQSTGAPIPDLSYLELIYADGLYSVIVGDCVTTSPTKAPAPPA